MSIWKRIFAPQSDREAVRALYSAIVRVARQPHWYIRGQVADTVDGRFNMVAAILSLVLLRLEREPSAMQQASWLTEIFVDDMDGQLREFGVGDVMVGKHVGRIMGALGGRMGAYRDAFAAFVSGNVEPLESAVERNIPLDDGAQGEAHSYLANHLYTAKLRLDEAPLDALLAGEINIPEHL